MASSSAIHAAAVSRYWLPFICDSNTDSRPPDHVVKFDPPHPKISSEITNLLALHSVRPILESQQATQQSQGIQTLLEAEKEAAKVVQKARQYRVQKLKDARSEAAKEIEAYKVQKQKDYEAYEAEHKSQTSTNQHSIDESTNKQLAEIKADVEKNRSNVIDKILKRVTQTHPALHKNLRKIEA
ncbi:hypothetical protein NCC49_005511 [Naganishia albida]|nr:hypothetical protein NCC49_005511 [Naganishia albida]